MPSLPPTPDQHPLAATALHPAASWHLPPAITVVGPPGTATELAIHTLRRHGLRTEHSGIDDAVDLIAAGSIPHVVLSPSPAAGIAAVLRALEPHPHTTLIAVVEQSPVSRPSSLPPRLELADSPQALIRAVRALRPALRSPLITPAQSRVMQKVVEGLSPAQVAQALQVTVTTVNNHLAEVNRRLGVHNITQAVLACIRLGLADPTVAAEGHPARERSPIAVGPRSFTMSAVSEALRSSGLQTVHVGDAATLAAIAEGRVALSIVRPRSGDELHELTQAATRHPGTVFGLLVDPGDVTVARQVRVSTPTNVTAVTTLSEVLELVRDHLPDPGPHRLNDGQMRLMQLMADGMTTAEAAAHLGVIDRTVNNALTRVHRELGSTNLAQAVLSCVRSGAVFIAR